MTNYQFIIDNMNVDKFASMLTSYHCDCDECPIRNGCNGEITCKENFETWLLKEKYEGRY